MNKPKPTKWFIPTGTFYNKNNFIDKTFLMYNKLHENQLIKKKKFTYIEKNQQAIRQILNLYREKPN